MTTKIFLYILSAGALIYLLVLLVFTTGWYRLKPFTASLRHFSTKISVVVAFRNERMSLQNLLNSLCQQTYSKELLEIILVDDHSEDESVSIVNQFIQQNKSCTIRLIKASGNGKKKALHEGIHRATGDLIVTTDADCLAHKNWLVKLAAFFEQEHPLLIIGPVVYTEVKGGLQKFFSLEFMSLVASGAGSAAAHLPLMGNGANMAFEKDVFLEAGAEAQKQQLASGDDVFLIHYLSRKYGRRTVRFIKNKEAIIRTPAPKNLKQFLSQRARWGSKAKAYDLAWPLIVSFTVLIFNLLLAAAFIYGFYTPWFWMVFLLFVILKYLIDFPLLKDFSDFTGNHKLVALLFPFEFIYPFYILIAATKGLFFSFDWKGRKVR
ncbi:MAG: glycosyltransferase [Bacteroidales bacterium]|nr:glycosyltransferase [Bacteroidales bacterium]